MKVRRSIFVSLLTVVLTLFLATQLRNSLELSEMDTHPPALVAVLGPGNRFISAPPGRVSTGAMNESTATVLD
jgi:hypothetical protein